MTTKWMSIPLFNALMNAGVDEELARTAASAAATPDHLESRIEALNTKINTCMGLWVSRVTFAVLLLGSISFGDGNSVAGWVKSSEGSSPSGAARRATSLYSVDPCGSGP